MTNDQLRLRPFTTDDDAEVTNWFSDAGQLRMFAGKRLSWPLEVAQWDGIRNDPTITAWTAVLGDDPTPVGHGELVTESPQLVRIARIGIAPAARGNGLGRLMLSQLIEKARLEHYERAILFVHPDNSVAIRAYRGLGFEAVGGQSNNGHMKMEASLV
jgi:RimJ/RimL family protein N-acetyltransferase